MSLGFASGSNVRGLTVTFDVPQDGLVLVQVEEYSYTDLALEVSLEAAE